MHLCSFQGTPFEKVPFYNWDTAVQLNMITKKSGKYKTFCMGSTRVINRVIVYTIFKAKTLHHSNLVGKKP